MARGSTKKSRRFGRSVQAPSRRRRERRADLLRLAFAHQSRGQVAEAEAQYRRFLEYNPGHAVALHHLGLLLQQTGRASAAADTLEEAAVAAPADPSVHNNRGNVLRSLERYPQAVEAYRAALALDPRHLNARFNLAGTLRALGDVSGAIEAYRQLVAAAPDDAVAWDKLGDAYLEEQAAQRALECLEKAVALNPRLASAHCNLGRALTGLGRPEDAEQSLRRAIEIDPRFPEARFNLGSLLRDQGRLAQASEQIDEAVRLRPDYVKAHYARGLLHWDGHRPERAIECFRRCLEIDPEFAPAHSQLGVLLLDREGFDAAKDEVEAALRLDPNLALAHNNRGRLHLDAGEIDAATRCFETALALEPDFVDAWFNLSLMRAYCDAHPEMIERLQALLHGKSLPEPARATLHFALGKLRHDRGEYDSAFESYREANRLTREARPFDRAELAERVRGLEETCDRAFFERMKGSDVPTTVPVFIVGAPRSGTTLIEQVLSAHPDVHGGGELLFIPKLTELLSRRHRHAGGYPRCLPVVDKEELRSGARAYLESIRRLDREAARITDKLPGNFLHLGLIAILFPRARIIHCRRDAMDVCLSNYLQRFHDGHFYSYDLADLGWFYRQYERLMAHWREVLPVSMFEVHYEDFVRDPEAWSRAMVDYCGLPWDARCLRFDENRRAVHTASNLQIRQPLYRSSVGRWRVYEPHLDELKRALRAESESDGAGGNADNRTPARPGYGGASR